MRSESEESLDRFDKFESCEDDGNESSSSLMALRMAVAAAVLFDAFPCKIVVALLNIKICYHRRYFGAGGTCSTSF